MPPDVSSATTIFFGMMAADGGARARKDLAAAKGSPHRPDARTARLARERAPRRSGLLRAVPTLGGAACRRARVSDVLRCRPRARHGRAPPRCTAARQEPTCHSRATTSSTSPTPTASPAFPSPLSRSGRRAGCRSAFRSSRIRFTTGSRWPSRRSSRPAGTVVMTVMPESPPILLAEGMHKRYGGVHALRGATLRVNPAEVHALMGENGSGKSTMLRILSGQIAPGRRVDRIRGPTDLVPHADRRAAPGHRDGDAGNDARTRPFGRREHLPRPPDGKARRPRRTGRRRARGPAPPSSDSGSSSTRPCPSAGCGRTGEQMVEIARALSIDARLLILDEPTSSLTDDEVESLFAVVRKLRDDGVSTIFVSHRIDEVFELADRISVLRDGHSVGEATTAAPDQGTTDPHDGRTRARGGDPRGGGERRRRRLPGDLCSPRADSRRRGCSRTSTSTSAPARSSGSRGWSERAEASCWRRSSACARRALERWRSTGAKARSARRATPSAAASASSRPIARHRASSWNDERPGEPRHGRRRLACRG